MLVIILKIIGIIIAVILGILVLLLCVVLFVPLRYQIQGRSEGTMDTLKGRIKVTWLLHLFRADVYYKEQKVMWRIRFGFLKRMGGKKGGVHDEENEEEREKISEEVDEEPEEIKSSESASEEFAEDQKNLEKVAEKISSDDERVEEGAEEGTEKDEKKRKSLSQKLQTFIQKIKCTFQRLCDKIKLLTEKKDRLAEFVQDESHIRAYKSIKRELFWYLKKLKPKKIEAVVQYGFDDPSYTGKLLAALAVLYPFMSEDTKIIPDFEHEVFKGRFAIEGKLKVSHIAHTAWRLFWNRDVRSSYKDIKNFEW